MRQEIFNLQFSISVAELPPHPKRAAAAKLRHLESGDVGQLGRFEVHPVPVNGKAVELDLDQPPEERRTLELDRGTERVSADDPVAPGLHGSLQLEIEDPAEIERASCRERV